MISSDWKNNWHDTSKIQFSVALKFEKFQFMPDKLRWVWYSPNLLIDFAFGLVEKSSEAPLNRPHL